MGGHIAGIVLAHRLTLHDAPGRATVAGLPIVALMIGYTVLSLWIIAQPIVVEPGVQPARLRWLGTMTEVSIAVAFAAGILSFISPCVLALLPVYLAFLGNAAVADGAARSPPPAPPCCRRRCYSSPASASSSSCSATRSASSAARCFAIPEARMIVGVLVIVIGVLTTGVFGPVFDRLQVGVNPEWLPAARSTRALALGGLVAIGWTPCIGPVLGAIFTMGASSGSAPR